MRTITSPFLTRAPSLKGSAMISPPTSGVILTSISGCTLPVAVTRWVMLRTMAFSTVTMVGFSVFLFFAAAAAPSTTRSAIAPRMSQRRLRDFFLAGTGAGATGAVWGVAVAGMGISWSVSLKENVGGWPALTPRPPARPDPGGFRRQNVPGPGSTSTAGRWWLAWRYHTGRKAKVAARFDEWASGGMSGGPGRPTLAPPGGERPCPAASGLLAGGRLPGQGGAHNAGIVVHAGRDHPGLRAEVRHELVRLLAHAPADNDQARREQPVHHGEIDVHPPRPLAPVEPGALAHRRRGIALEGLAAPRPVAELGVGKEHP